MIKLYFSRENNTYYGSACLSEEKLKEHQQKLLEKLKGFEKNKIRVFFDAKEVVSLFKYKINT